MIVIFTAYNAILQAYYLDPMRAGQARRLAISMW
jgi:hypothetical protein